MWEQETVKFKPQTPRAVVPADHRLLRASWAARADGWRRGGLLGGLTREVGVRRHLVCGACAAPRRAGAAPPRAGAAPAHVPDLLFVCLRVSAQVSPWFLPSWQQVLPRPRHPLSVLSGLQILFTTPSPCDTQTSQDQELVYCRSLARQGSVNVCWMRRGIEKMHLGCFDCFPSILCFLLEIDLSKLFFASHSSF